MQANTPNAANSYGGSPTTRAPGAPADGSFGPFTAETLTRNPELAAILKKLYGDIGNLSTDPNVNQTVLQKNVKSPEVEAAAQAGLKAQQADATNNAQSISDFAKTFMAAQPGAEANTAQETGAIGKLYSGEYAKALAENRKQAALLSSQNLARRLSSLAGAGNLGDLTRGGVTNSFANANLMRAGADASMARDLEMAKQQREDIQQILAQQLAASGLRNRLTDATLSRALVPIQAGQAVAGADTARLGALSSIIGANNVYTPQTRSGLLGNTLDLYKSAAGLDPAAYYRYVKGEFPNNVNSGVVPQQPVYTPRINRGGAGGLSFQDIIDAMQGGGATPNTGFPGGMPEGPAPAPRSAYTGMNRNPFKHGPSTANDPLNSLRSKLFDEYTSGNNAGQNTSDVMNWLHSLTPEQLNNVPRAHDVPPPAWGDEPRDPYDPNEQNIMDLINNISPQDWRNQPVNPWEGRS